MVLGCDSVGGRGGGPLDLAGAQQLPDAFTELPPATLCASDPMACYTVYAHSDTRLYSIDLMKKQIVTVGDFNTPTQESITDLAVAPDNTIWVVSKTTLFTADPNDGHVTKKAALKTCGTFAVALTFANDATLYAGDHDGNFCQIDYTQNPPTVTPVAKLSGGLALSGDIVAVGDGTMYGTAYRLSDASGKGTQVNNLLVKIDPMTARTTVIGSTGTAELFGISYALGQVFGFSHDGSGDCITINPSTGKGTPYNSFKDPATGSLIKFAGAGVNSLVQAAPVQ
jgi:hypothetical protein